jgi:hypothetical protein
MTHDPTRDCEHGRLKGKCDVCDLQAEVLEQCRINGMSAEREDALAAEVERLNKALTWEQNRAERIGTHGPGCHTWGPAHYECLLRVNAELVEALQELIGCPYDIDTATVPKAGIDAAPSQVVGTMSVALMRLRKARAALAKATGETK